MDHFPYGLENWDFSSVSSNGASQGTAPLCQPVCPRCDSSLGCGARWHSGSRCMHRPPGEAHLGKEQGKIPWHAHLQAGDAEWGL